MARLAIGSATMEPPRRRPSGGSGPEIWLCLASQEGNCEHLRPSDPSAKHFMPVSAQHIRLHERAGRTDPQILSFDPSDPDLRLAGRYSSNLLSSCLASSKPKPAKGISNCVAHALFKSKYQRCRRTLRAKIARMEGAVLASQKAAPAPEFDA